MSTSLVERFEVRIALPEKPLSPFPKLKVPALSRGDALEYVERYVGVPLEEISELMPVIDAFLREHYWVKVHGPAHTIFIKDLSKL